MMVRLTLKRVLVALVIMGLCGMLFAWSGLFRIAASSGHWQVSSWLLHWAMQNSVRTWSAVEAPERTVESIALVSAAGHFRQSCQTCHGAPGVSPSPAMQAATPHAPDLARTVGHYSDRELFWIVRHGIKYTGMPAWPTQERPDEVRRMVGFLRRLPGMTAAQYRELTETPATAEAFGAERATLAQCAGCHGADGLGRGQPDIPVIAGQKRGYLLAMLRDYRNGTRASGPMQVAAAALDESQMQALAAHYASRPGLKDEPLPVSEPIFAKGLPRRQLPACSSCHAPGKDAPLIAGQRASYVAGRLHNWRGEKTTIDADKSQLPMPVIARRIPGEMIDPLANTLATAAASNDQ